MQNLTLCRIILPCCSKSFFNSGEPLSPTHWLRRVHLNNSGILIFSHQSYSNKSKDRPYIYHLEHVQKRLEFSVPLMFRYRPDYTFYRDDVLMEDYILNTERRGLDSVRQYLGLVAIVGTSIFPYIEARILNCVPLIDDGTVNLRWRIVYITYLQFPAIIYHRAVNKVDLMEKRLKWCDGYSIFHVDGEGLVYKFTIQRMMPDLESKMKEKTKELVKKVAVPTS